MPFDGGFLAYDGNHAPKEPFVLNDQSSLARNLVALWPFQSQPSPCLSDITPARSIAVVQDPANVTTVATLFGLPGLSFPGSGNNDVIAPDSAKFDLSGGSEITIAMWIDFQGNIGQSGWSHIVSKRTTGTGAAIWATAIEGNGRIIGRYMAGGTERIVETSSGYHAAGMKHVVFTRKAGTTGTNVAVYINGVSVALLKSENNTSNLDNSTRDVWFGARDGEQLNRRFQGLLGQVSISNRAWTAQEVLFAYNPGSRWSLISPLSGAGVWLPVAAAAGGGEKNYYSGGNAMNRMHRGIGWAA